MGKKHFAKYLPGIIFILFIGIMSALFLFLPNKTYSSNEKRYLSSFPKLTADTLFDGSFGKEYETYMADHIAGRDFFVGLDAYYNLYTGRNGSNGVYSGKNGYLINKPANIESSLARNVSLLADFAKNNNISASLMVVPSTGYIINSNLPLVHYSYNDDLLFSKIEENKGELNFIDLRKSFKQYSLYNKPLYYKTDHHWTTFGAYCGYWEYCTNKGIVPTPIENFSTETYGNFYGTTYSTSALWLNSPDTIDIYKNPANSKENIKVSVTEGTDTKEYDSMFFMEHLSQDDKYPVFLDGNHSLVRISNSNAPSGKLLLIKDSFSHSMAPFLADNYSEIIMVDLRYYKSPVSEIIKNEGITNVLMLYGIDNLSTDDNINFLS